MATYYVSKSGSDSNPGTQASPKLTIGAGRDLLAPGDTLLVGDGTYNEAITLGTGGTAAGGHKTLRSLNKWGAKVVATASNNTFNGQGCNYWRIVDFDITSPNSFGIELEYSHHVEVIGNRIHDCAGSGLSGVYCEEWLVEGNLCEDNASGSWYSGLGFYQQRQLTDDYDPNRFRTIIRNNVCRGNFQTNGPFTDGNGIIIDDWQHTQAFSIPTTGGTGNAYTASFGTLGTADAQRSHYFLSNRANTGAATMNGTPLRKVVSGSEVELVAGDIQNNTRYLARYNGSIFILHDRVYPYPALVENNLCYDNGGKGIQVFVTNNITVRNNLAYGNNTDTKNTGTYRGDLSNQEGQNNTWVNNIGIAHRVGKANKGDALVANAGTTGSNRALANYSPVANGNLGTIWRNNLTYDLSSPGSSSLDIQNTGSETPTGANGNILASNPLVVTLTRDPATADFRLQSGSPAIDAGTNSFGLPSIDLAGNARVSGTAVDIGPYEFGSSPPGGSTPVRAALASGRPVLAGGRLLLGG